MQVVMRRTRHGCWIWCRVGLYEWVLSAMIGSSGADCVRYDDDDAAPHMLARIASLVSSRARCGRFPSVAKCSLRPHL